MDKEEEEQKNPGKKSRQEEEVREVEMTSNEEPGVTGTKSLSDLSVGEDARMQIREHNLRRYKMLRTQMGLKYEADLTNQEKKQIRHDEGGIISLIRNSRSWRRL